MYQKSETNLGRFFNLPNPGLRAYFSHTVEGNPEDYRPPFWSGMSRSSVLAEWDKVIANTGVEQTLPGLYQYEMEMRGKVGPMSIQVPLKDRISSIESYYTMVEHPGEPIDANAVKAAGAYFSRGGGVRLRSQTNTIKGMRLSTNSGSPYFTTRRNVVEKTVPCQITTGEQKLPRGQSYGMAAVLGWRGQEGGPKPSDVKQRVVWMYPFALNVRELQLYQPAIESVQKNGLLPAYVSMDAVDDCVTKLWASKPTDQAVVCTDFSAFDQHFNEHLQSAAETILRQMTTKSADMEEWFRDIFPCKYTLPLVCCPKCTYTGPHGMGSGSGGTNFDESIVHRALQYEAAMSAGSVLNESSQCLGDDGMISYPGIKVEDVIRSYTRHGLEMNPDKQYVSTHDCIYLRRYHSEDFRERGTMVGVYSTYRALGRLLAQERFYDPAKWGPKMVTLRAWSIIENCSHSPYFEEFVDFVIKGDKYRLGLDLPGFIEDIGHIARDAKDQLPDFLGYTKTLQNPSADGGITDWRIYKYLKSKA